MAVIQKIRTKYAKLAGFVIALALVGFILMDAASGGLRDLFGRDSSVATVDGEKIDYKEYAQRIKEYESLYAYSSPNRPMDDATRAQINSQALNELINEKLVQKEAEKLGLKAAGENELIYGPNPDPVIQQFQIQGTPVFMNESGMFDAQRVKGFEQQVNQIDPSGKIQEQWVAVKEYVKRNDIIKKYNNMVSGGIYIPKFIIDAQVKEQSSMASISFVKVPHAIINDAEVKVTDEDLVAYMKKKAPLYTIEEPTRSIEYISFDVVPTDEDTARALGALQQLKNEFATTSDVESFVNRNSEEPYKGDYVNKKTFMSAYADSIMNLPEGSVYGPYFENSTYKLTKVMNKSTLPDSVKVRHILVKTEDREQSILSDTAGKARIDSAVAAINSGASFDSVAIKYTDDKNQAGMPNNNAEYEITLQQRSTLSKEFADFAFEGRAGEKKTVKVDNDAYSGYHYIEILDQKSMQSAAKLATVAKTLYSGDNTENAVYAKATEFAGKYGEAKAFDDAVKKQNLNKRLGESIKENDFQISGLGPAREIVRWMYEAKIGDVSSVFSMDGKYVVAKLASETEPGLMKLDANMRPVIEAAVKAEKKSDVIINKYKSATSLQAIASASGQPAQQADSFSAATPFIGNLGYEPKVVGYTFYEGFKMNTLSPGIKGQDGVLYISVVNRFKRQMPLDDTNMREQQRGMMEGQTKNTVNGMIGDMLKKGVKVKYNGKML